MTTASSGPGARAAAGSAPTSDPRDSAWLTGCRVVDVRSGQVREHASVETAGGLIARVEDGPPPRGVGAIDLKGLYLLPGLITCHVHLQGLYPYSLRDERESPARTALRASLRARQALAAGVTTIRCVHEQHQVDLVLREAAARGWVESPRILAGGRALTTTGGHGHGLGCVVADGHDGFLRAARTELAAGADHVKVFLTGGLARPGESLNVPQLTEAEVAAIVRAARERGTYVAAHAAGSTAIRQGLQAGIRSFEHAYELDRDTAEMLAAADAFLIPTLTVTHSPGWLRAQGFDDTAIARSEAARERHMESAQRAVAAGVQIVNGTDFPPGDHENGTPLVVHEMELLVQAGLSPLGSLQAATLQAARLLRLESVIGAVEPGKAADLVAVEGDPTQSVRPLRHPRLRMQAGRIRD